MRLMAAVAAACLGPLLVVEVLSTFFFSEGSFSMNPRLSYSVMMSSYEPRRFGV